MGRSEEGSDRKEGRRIKLPPLPELIVSGGSIFRRPKAFVMHERTDQLTTLPTPLLELSKY